MQLFFAVTGAQGNLAIVMGTAPSLLVFSLVQVTTPTPTETLFSRCMRCNGFARRTDQITVQITQIIFTIICKNYRGG